MACADTVINNLWHAISAVAEVPTDVAAETMLLGERIYFRIDPGGDPVVWRKDVDTDAGAGDASSNDRVPAKLAYGYIWASLGNPPEDLFDIEEFAEPDRRNLNAATFGVNVSAPRAVENFLDLGHFPYVHTDILGVEPHTEVREYDVEVHSDRDEIIATRCRFYQPLASAASDDGADVEYIYRVPHPYCAVLYKSSPVDEARMDVIALFLQPLDQERVRAHMLLSVLDDRNSDGMIRTFQQTIFGQDKPILENQVPKRLPLDPRAETPIRADKSAIAYRHWLREKGVTYGVIPAAA